MEILTIIGAFFFIVFLFVGGGLLGWVIKGVGAVCGFLLDGCGSTLGCLFWFFVGFVMLVALFI